jgi:hypothetical protein
MSFKNPVAFRLYQQVYLNPYPKELLLGIRVKVESVLHFCLESDILGQIEIAAAVP